MRELDEVDAALLRAVKDYVHELLASTHTPGLTVAIARGGSLIWQAGFGLADASRQTPMTPQTVTRGGSLSKLYTATAVLQLVEQEVIGLYDPIERHLEGIQLANPLGERPVTVYDLLTFRSGLATDMTDARARVPEGLREYLRTSYSNPVLREYGETIPRWSAKVGNRYQYSNLGIATLGYMVEQVNPTRLRFPDYIAKYVLTPLGMVTTALPPVPDQEHVASALMSNLSTGYAAFGPIRLKTPDIYCAPYPACGLLTVPGDHIRLLLALGNGGRLEESQILRPATVRIMLSPHAAIADVTDIPHGWWTGLGVMIVNREARNHYFGYAGSHAWGWWNDSRLYPRLDCAVVACSNSWDMVSWHNPGMAPVPSRVCDFVASWLMGTEGRGPVSRANRTWAWKVSYLVGVLMGERMQGLLGLNSQAAGELIDGMAVEVDDRAPLPVAQPLWEPSGFRAGVADILGAHMTLSGVKEFLTSDASQLGVSEQKLAFAELGGVGDVPMPLSFWSHVQDEGPLG